MSDFVYIVLWSVALACLVGGSLFLGIHGNGSLLFALRLARLLARSHHFFRLHPGILERSIFDQLEEGILLLLRLLVMELKSLAPLADFDPAENIIGGDSQLLCP